MKQIEIEYIFLHNRISIAHLALFETEKLDFGLLVNPYLIVNRPRKFR